jgi:SAM-dependent methyltransferase
MAVSDLTRAFAEIPLGSRVVLVTTILDHYGGEGLTGRILAALGGAGPGSREVNADQLAGVDEFHLGGRVMTDKIVEVLAPSGPSDVLDVGSGIGGAARTLARHLDCAVTGIDLTPEYVSTASDLTALVGLEDSVTFKTGSATSLPVADASVDVVTLLHVGMNIADKATMATEFARVLRPGGTLVLYDIMRVGDGSIDFPMPWSSVSDSSFVERPDVYVEALIAAGFDVGEPESQTELVLDVLASGAGRPPPPLNPGLLMGPEFPTMISNVVRAVKGSTLAPVLILATAEAK